MSRVKHNAGYIKVKFISYQLKKHYLEPHDSDRESLDSEDDDNSHNDWKSLDSKDERVSPYPQLKNFLKPKGWILEGNRDDLENRICEALGGNPWGSNWMERGPSGKGWYIDSWITRHVNGGLAEYI